MSINNILSYFIKDVSADEKKYYKVDILAIPNDDPCLYIFYKCVIYN